MFSFLKKKGPTLGLDINNESITLLQLDSIKIGLQLSRFSQRPTPANSIHEGLITNPEAVGTTVRELLDEMDLPASGSTPILNAIIPGQSVIARLLPVPVGMPSKELSDVVTQEAVNHVPFPLSEAYLHWSIMPTTERTDADGIRRVDVILAAVQKSIVDTYWQMADWSKTKIGKLDISPLALLRGLSLSGYLRSDSHLIMTVNIRTEATDITLVRAGMPLFTRSVLLGWATLTESLSRSLNIGLNQASELLPQILLSGTAPVDPQIGQATQIARTVFGDIIDEIGRSLEFYQSQAGEVQIQGLLLCGPGCRIPQVDQFVSARLNLSAELVNPLRDIVHDPALIAKGHQSDYVMALGTAVPNTALTLNTVDMDLNQGSSTAAPLEEGEEGEAAKQIQSTSTPWFIPALSLGLVLLLVTGGLWLYLSQYDLPKKLAELTGLSGKIEKETKQLDSLALLKAENRRLQEKETILANIVHHEQQLASLLQILQDNDPQGIQLTQINIAGSRLILKGKAIDFASVSDLSLNLGNCARLKDPTLDYAKRLEVDPRAIEFQLTTSVSPLDRAAPAQPATGSGPSVSLTPSDNK